MEIFLRENSQDILSDNLGGHEIFRETLVLLDVHLEELGESFVVESV